MEQHGRRATVGQLWPKVFCAAAGAWAGRGGGGRQRRLVAFRNAEGWTWNDTWTSKQDQVNHSLSELKDAAKQNKLKDQQFIMFMQYKSSFSLLSRKNMTTLEGKIQTRQAQRPLAPEPERMNPAHRSTGVNGVGHPSAPPMAEAYRIPLDCMFRAVF